MIFGRGECSGEQLLILGLSAENIRRLLMGKPIMIKRETHGDAVPDGWNILILAGETEEKISRELKQAGLIDDMTSIFKDSRLGKDGT